MTPTTMRKCLAIAAALFIAVDASAAPPSQESVEALLAVTKTQTMMDSVYGNVEQMMRQGVQQAAHGETLSAEQQRVLDAVPARFVAVLREEFNWEKMKPMYVQIYRDSFDQEEIDGLVAFYRSPAGQALVNKMPGVMQKSMAMAQSQMQALIPRMKAAIDSAITDAKISKWRVTASSSPPAGDSGPWAPWNSLRDRPS